MGYSYELRNACNNLLFYLQILIMNINQLAEQMYGKYMTDLNPQQQDYVRSEYERQQQK